MHTKITPVIYDERKTNLDHSAKDMFNRTDLKSFHKDLSVRPRTWLVTWACENKREDERLLTNPLKS